MRRSLALGLLLLFTLTDGAFAQRGGSRQQRSSWAHDGVHLLVDGKWIEPLSGEEVPAKPEPAAEEKPALRGKMKEALKKSVAQPGGQVYESDDQHMEGAPLPPLPAATTRRGAPEAGVRGDAAAPEPPPRYGPDT